MRIGIIGAGAIAAYLLEEIKKDTSMIVQSIFIRNHKKYEHMAEKYNVTLCTDFEQFLQSELDIVIEAANVATATKYLPALLTQQNVILISVGALAKEDFLTKIKGIAEQYQQNLYVPSGAIGGLDFVQNVANAGLLKEVSLETRKRADTLITERITEEKMVFQGNASEAIEKFPKNINVSIALALAGVGLNKTKVTLIADPHIEKNIHTIQIVGESGTGTFTFINEPLPSNPNTSYLAAISIMGTLKRIGQKVKIGI